MLKRIPSILSPELWYLIAQMGQGDKLVIADANFPAVTNAKRLVRADGHSVPAILGGTLQLAGDGCAVWPPFSPCGGFGRSSESRSPTPGCELATRRTIQPGGIRASALSLKPSDPFLRIVANPPDRGLTGGTSGA